MIFPIDKEEVFVLRGAKARCENTECCPECPFYIPEPDGCRLKDIPINWDLDGLKSEGSNAQV